MRIVLVTLLGLILIGPFAILALLSTHTVLDPHPSPGVLSGEMPLTVRAVNPHGVRAFRASLEQDGRSATLLDEEHPARRFLFWRGAPKAPQEFKFVAGQRTVPGLHNGKARLVLQAVSNDLLASTDHWNFDVDVNLNPPGAVADGAQHYIHLGGSELVGFRASGYWTEAGVRVGKYTFPSHPKPGGAEGERFSLFAYPYDVAPDTEPIVYVRNPGQEATAHFWHRIFPKKFRTRTLDLNDKFLDKVIADVDPNGSGDKVARFVKINSQTRAENQKAIEQLAAKSEERFLWNGPFQQMENSKVESQFCDYRTYTYEGKKIDQAVHLGFDLATVQHAPILAANDGRVVHAGRLGIFGNCVILDHGYGLQSLYAHMSEIGVKVGDLVKKQQLLGKSGSTGLAGGDHLHFSMYLDGVAVNPVEWWDAHWIQDRILSKVGPNAK
jgi:hypothetical protein